MKNMFKTLIFTIVLLSGFSAQSQNPDRFPRIRERIAQAKLREIQVSLKLDQPTFDRFSPVYLRYEREIASVDFRKIGRLMKIDADSLSVEEADRLIVNQMEAAKSLILIREKYYHEFRKVIEPQQIIKLYQTEAEIRKKVMQEMKRRMMNK